PSGVLVAVEHDRRVVADPLGPQQVLEARAIDVVADQRIVEIGHPVDFHSPGDMAGLIQQDVLVRLGDTDVRVVEVIGHPLGGDQYIGTRVAPRVNIGYRRHSLGHCPLLSERQPVLRSKNQSGCGPTLSGTTAAHELLIRLPYTKAVPTPDPDNGAMLQRQALALPTVTAEAYGSMGSG